MKNVSDRLGHGCYFSFPVIYAVNNRRRSTTPLPFSAMLYREYRQTLNSELIIPPKNPPTPLASGTHHLDSRFNSTARA